MQFCSSMKTDFRIIIASLKIVGLMLVLASDGSTSVALGPGGGCIEVLNVGFDAILVGNLILNAKVFNGNDDEDLGSGRSGRS